MDTWAGLQRYPCENLSRDQRYLNLYLIIPIYDYDHFVTLFPPHISQLSTFKTNK